MKRRVFVTGFAGLLAAPLVAEARQAGKAPRIGFLAGGSSVSATAHEVRAGHQPQDRQGPRPHHSALAAAADRSGDRVVANRHPRLVTFRGLLGQSTTIQNSSSLRIGCGTRQAGHIAVSVSVSTTGSSKLICLLRYPLSALVGALTAIQH